MRRLLIPFILSLAACGQSVPIGNNTESQATSPDTVTPDPVPVRIGELGPNLAACTAAGTTRRIGPSETLSVRSAPFDNGEQSGAVPANGRFFVCARSLDQKWLGIVYASGFTLDPACGVSDPIPARRAYSGSCSSGWVSSPFVKLIAGNDQLPAANQAAPESSESAATAASKS